MGFEQRLGRNWSLLVEPCYWRLDKLVVEQESTTGRVTNDGEGTNLGLDGVLSRRYAGGWSGSAGCAFNKARINDNDGLGDCDADFNRTHFISIGASRQFDPRRGVVVADEGEALPIIALILERSW